MSGASKDEGERPGALAFVGWGDTVGSVVAEVDGAGPGTVCRFRGADA